MEIGDIMELIDLHTHSHYSDGNLSPTELVELAKKTGIKTLALVDHDNVEGLDEAENKCKELGIEFIPGIEISVLEDGANMHILGFWIDRNNPEIKRITDGQKTKRIERIKKFVNNLKDAGFKIEYEELKKFKKVGTTGRPHLAMAILEHEENKELLKSLSLENEALRDTIFREFLVPGRPTYVEERFELTIKEAID